MGNKLRTVNFHSFGHFGDCLPCIHLLNKVIDSNKDINNIFFTCNTAYHSQLSEIIEHKEIKLTDTLYERSINLWGYPKEITDYSLPFPHHKNFSDKYPHLDSVGKMLFKIFQYRCESNDIIFPFNSPNDIIFDEKIFDIKVSESYDYLVINSNCLSGQMRMNQATQYMIFDKFLQKLSKLGKTFITTQQHKQYPCTNRSAAKVGQLAKNVKCVIGVPTGIYFPCINKYAIENGVKFVNFTRDGCTWDYTDNFETIRNLDLYNIE